jgi:hypothetical protein
MKATQLKRRCFVLADLPWSRPSALQDSCNSPKPFKYRLFLLLLILFGFAVVKT